MSCRGVRSALFCFLLAGGLLTRGALADNVTTTMGPGDPSKNTTGKSGLEMAEDEVENVVENLLAFAVGGSSEDLPAETSASTPGQATTIQDTTVKITTTEKTTQTTTTTSRTTTTTSTTTTEPTTTTTRKPRIRPNINCDVDVCLSKGYQSTPRLQEDNI